MSNRLPGSHDEIDETTVRLPGSEGIAAGRIAPALLAAGNKGMTLADLAAVAAVTVDEARVALADLERKGQAVEWARRYYALGHTDWTVGRVELLDGGDAQVRPAARREPGFHIARRALAGAADGDTVLVKRSQGTKGTKGTKEPKSRKGSKGPRGRGAQRGSEQRPRLPEASIVKVLDRRSRTIVGVVERSADARGARGEEDAAAGRPTLQPFDVKIEADFDLIGAADVPDGHYVVVEVEPSDGGAADGRRRRARVIEVLGDADQPGVDVLVVLRHHGIPEPFPAAVLAAAAHLPANPTPSDWDGREDLRHIPIVTIDGETARDFDDALSIERLPGGRFALGVHIADVAHYVEEGTALDLEAYRRGTSVYFPERAVPMLPEGLSNGLCSLRPRVPRLTQSVFLEIGPAGQILRRRFAETVIQSSRRMTYSEVRRVLEEPAAGDAAEYGGLLALFRDLHDLMMVLRAARLARGSIDFDLPEGDVVLDTDGYTVGIRPGERNVAHRIVEEAMIAANEAVAFEEETRLCPTLYRVHDAPSPERLEELRELLHPLGISLKGDLESLHPSALQDVLAEVAGRPEEPFVSALVLRSVQRAVYSPECRGHYALAARYYLHFTSPIRRYPDLVAHRRLRALLRGTAEAEAAASLLGERLAVMGEHCSRTERRAEQAERDLLQWKKVRFLAERVGERFSGRVTGVQPFGLFVQLADLYVDGLVPVRTMTDDFYVFEPAAHRLVGARAGRRFQLGDVVEVELVRVDLRHRGLDLRLVDMPPPSATESSDLPPRRPGARSSTRPAGRAKPTRQRPTRRRG